METPNNYGQRCIDRLHDQILSGAIDMPTQVQIIELLAAHLQPMTLTAYAQRKGISYQAARKHSHDFVLDGVKFFLPETKINLPLTNNNQNSDNDERHKDLRDNKEW